MADDAFCDATESEMLQAGMSVGWDDDQVDLKPARESADFFKCSSFTDVDVFRSQWQPVKFRDVPETLARADVRREIGNIKRSAFYPDKGWHRFEYVNYV